MWIFSNFHNSLNPKVSPNKEKDFKESSSFSILSWKTNENLSIIQVEMGLKIDGTTLDDDKYQNNIKCEEIWKKSVKV